MKAAPLPRAAALVIGGATIAWALDVKALFIAAAASLCAAALWPKRRRTDV